MEEDLHCPPSMIEQSLSSSHSEHFPTMKRLLREQVVGRTVIDLIVYKDSTILALDNGSVLEMTGLSFEFLPERD
jgi:hypothetical protein